MFPGSRFILYLLCDPVVDSCNFNVENLLTIKWEESFNKYGM